ncbi:MAG TPA: T9SS type A sorting domain-containing protein [Bacteroidales bacterium]|nr:T9SS type A sorting domain-containing protein [Bacteroidales bacterium]HNS45673.1 T9SS type A sorting domain-containing protein [Bacteroidales bacterium]
MKRIIIILWTGLLFHQGFAQVNLETIYQVSGALAQLETSGPKYYVMDWTNVQCRIYNMDHSLWKTVTLTVPTGYYLYDIRYVSEHLFNTDDLVELAVTYYYYEEAGQYYIYGSKIVNELGEELATIPGASYFQVYDAGDLGRKFLAYVYDYSVYPYPVQTWVYDLPGEGNSSGIIHPDHSFALSDPYPNPANSFVNITYHLPAGLTNPELQVIDLQGRILKSYPISRERETYQLDIRMYPKGVYLYRIAANSYFSESFRLIKP